jgi:hypothetical protein
MWENFFKEVVKELSTESSNNSKIKLTDKDRSAVIEFLRKNKDNLFDIFAETAGETEAGKIIMEKVIKDDKFIG